MRSIYKKAVLCLLGVCIVLVFLICFFCEDNEKNELNIKKNHAEYVKNYISEKYATTFILRDSDVDSDENKDIYYFSPADSDDIIVKTSYEESNSSGLINTVIPFEKHIKVTDDLVDKVKQYVCEYNELTIIDMEKYSIENTTTTIYNLMLDINKELLKYGVKTTKYSCSVKIIILKDNQEHNINFYVLDKDIIRDLLVQL